MPLSLKTDAAKYTDTVLLSCCPIMPFCVQSKIAHRRNTNLEEIPFMQRRKRLLSGDGYIIAHLERAVNIIMIIIIDYGKI